jgi:hypothetical protein
LIGVASISAEAVPLSKKDDLRFYRLLARSTNVPLPSWSVERLRGEIFPNDLTNCYVVLPAISLQSLFLVTHGIAFFGLFIGADANV